MIWEAIVNISVIFRFRAVTCLTSLYIMNVIQHLLRSERSAMIMIYQVTNTLILWRSSRQEKKYPGYWRGEEERGLLKLISFISKVDWDYDHRALYYE